MLRLASDVDFDGDLLRALRRRQPDIELARVQDVGLRTANDAAVLEWAATEGRILLTHDRKTMPKHANDRMKLALPMPGLIVVPQNKKLLGAMAEELLVIYHCTSQDEWNFRIEFLPL